MSKQIIFVDVNGALTSFRNELLTVENVAVSDSMLTTADVDFIISKLNDIFADEQIIFTSTEPENEIYSTIFVGKTDAFARHGDFKGLAETVDTNNQQKDDKAFVNLDNTSSLEEIIETIAHETAHLVGRMDHGGDGLDRYAHKAQLSGTISTAKVNVSQNFNCTADCGSYNTAVNVTVTSNLSVSNGGKASNVTICNDAKMTVLDQGYAENVTVIGSGTYLDNAQMLVYKGSTIKDINLAGGELLITDNGCKLTGELVLGGTKGGVNGSLMLSVKDDNIHDYVDPDWSDLNIVFDITSMNPAYLKTSADGMDVYFSDTRSIETPISYVDPANFIIRVSSGAEGGYYWLTNAEIDMTTYKPITFAKDVIFELDGENIGTFKWNKSKKAYELKTNSGYKASDYKDYQLYSNSMPTSITAHNLPGVVFTCKTPDPVLLYDAEDKLLASKKEFSGKFNVSMNGSNINKVVANEKGIVQNIVMTENSQLELNKGAKFLGNNTIAGNVKITGALANTQKDNISLTFDISACKANESAPILDGYEFISANVSGLTISVSAEKPESDEAEYILIDNIGSIQGSNLEEIAFTVNGKTLKEEYKGQYTFTWDEEYQKYTGINYNGYNYTLSTENNQLTLSVDKNDLTLVYYIDSMGTDNSIVDLYTPFLQNYINSSDTSIYIGVNGQTNSEDAAYHIIGGAAPTKLNEDAALSERLSLQEGSKIINANAFNELINLSKKSESSNRILFLTTHGQGYYIGNINLNITADIIKNGDFSVVSCTPLCLAGSLETSYAFLKNGVGAEYLVASPYSMTNNQVSYEAICSSVSMIKDKANTTAKEFADIIFEYTNANNIGKPLKKGIAVHNIQDGAYLVDKLNSLARVLQNSPNRDVYIDIFEDISDEKWGNIYYDTNYDMVDIKQFCIALKACILQQDITDKDTVSNIAGDIITYVNTHYDQKKIADIAFGGISIYMASPNLWAGNKLPLKNQNHVFLGTDWGNWLITLNNSFWANPHIKYVKVNSQKQALSSGINAVKTGCIVNNVQWNSEVNRLANSPNHYYVEIDNEAKRDGKIVIESSSDVDLRVNLYNATGDKLLNSYKGQKNVIIDVSNLQAGGYVYSVDTDKNTPYDIKYLSNVDSGIDHIDAISGSTNESIENSYSLNDGTYKGLVTNASDRDWYVIDTLDGSTGIIQISGKDIVKGIVSNDANARSSVGIYAVIHDGSDGNIVPFIWNANRNLYEAMYSGKGHLEIFGVSEQSIAYEITLISKAEYAADTSFCEEYHVTFDETNKIFSDKFTLAHGGKLSFSGEFCGLNGKLVISNSSGKKVANLNVKNGVIQNNSQIFTAGTYGINFSSSNKNSNNCTIVVKAEGTVFSKGNNADDEFINALPCELSVEDGWVGFGDETDYKMFDLVDEAKLSFTVEGTDASKFAIYSLSKKVDKKGNVTYSLKALQNNTLKLDKASGKYIVDTKYLLLENGTYYFSMTSTNAKKGGDCNYTVTVNDDSVFFTHGDDNSNDWLYDKKSGTVNDAVESIGQDTAIALDDWVGFGDAVDYHSFELTSAAKLSFNVNADDASNFAIYQLQEKVDKNGNVSYSLKTLQSNTLKLDKTSGKYIVETKDLLLENGTYYFSMTSTNAKKGGDCNYTVTVNDNSVFFTHGDDNSNDWLYDKKSGIINDAVGSIGQDTAIALDDWVGFGDAVDYHSFELTSAAKLSFNVNADDASNFAIYQLQEKVDKNGNVSYSLKTLQNNTLKLDKASGKYIVDTKDLLLTSGTYYVSMTSSNAKKGASCSYSIAVSEDSEAFPAELVSNNTTREAVDLSSSDAPGVVKAWDGNSAVFENWVGFGDAVDYVMFELEQNEKIDIDLKTEDGSLRLGKDIKVKLLNENGKALSLTGDMVSKTALSSGTYYVMVEIANEKKYQSEYTLQITSL